MSEKYIPEQERKIDYHFPEIQSEDDLKRLLKEGFDLLRSTKQTMTPEQRQNMMSGFSYYNMGYIARLFGGREGIKGKRIVEVAGGDVTPSDYISFTADTTRIFAALGAERVVLIDPAAQSINFTQFSNVDAIGEMVQDVPTPKTKFDVVTSTMFLGGPEWRRKLKSDQLFAVNMLKEMARFSDVQVHVSAKYEMPLEAVSPELLATADLHAIYNFDVSRQYGGGDNYFDDFLVIDNRLKR